MNKLNFKNLAMATTAIFALAACNNNEDVPSLAKEEASVNLRINIPTGANAATRGMVTDPSNKEIKISHIAGRVFKAGTTLATADKAIGEGDTDYTLTLGPVMVDGKEKVQVVLNNNVASTEVSIDKIQPVDGKGNLENAIYTATTANLGTASDVNGKKVYTVTADATSIAARLEVKGAAQFKKELVKSMAISYFAPVDYSLVYGQLGTVTLPSKSSLKMDVTPADVTAITTGGKVIANHLFHNDLASAVVGFKIEKYSCLLNGEGAYVIYNPKGTDEKYFIYETSDAGKYVVNMGTIQAPKYFDISVKLEDGKYNLTIAEEQNVQATLADTKSSVEYFGLANFGGTVDNKYEGGKVYKLNLASGMSWNKDGSKEYNPEENAGTDDPDKVKDKKEASIDVTVNVTTWNEVETSVEVQ